MIEKSEAVWAAKLHVKTTVKGAPGTMLGTAMTLAICEALVETEARLQRALDHDHGKALKIELARCLRCGDLDSPLTCPVSVPGVTSLEPGVLEFIDRHVCAVCGKEGGMMGCGTPHPLPLPSSPLQAIAVCPCGEPLPHAAPCAKSTDPEQGS